MLVSSAESRGSVNSETQGRSFMYRINYRGPKIEPLGTSYLIVCIRGLIELDKLLAARKVAPRRDFLRLSRVFPTSRVFTSGYVNKETILHFFIIYQMN